MNLAVNVVCRNWKDDRVIPRFSRYLADRLGWTLTARPLPGMDVYYLSGYFEWPLMKAAGLMKPNGVGAPMAAYFTHREEQPPGNGKAKQYDDVARRVALRIATAAMYAGPLAELGPTAQICPPVERERFTIPAGVRAQTGITAGFSGYTYNNGRKGESLARLLVEKHPWPTVEWRASGRGWPVKTKRYTWQEMPAFYQSLDVLVITSLVEGVPMPALEALACGVSLVIPRGVGLLDELPEVAGIHRYERGDITELVTAVSDAAIRREFVDREALRAVTEPYTVAAWCEQHRQAFEETFMIHGQEETYPERPERIEIAANTAVPYSATASPPSRGIYCVAFGEPARACAVRMMTTVRQWLPEVPIALCAAEPLGIEDVFIQQPDSDVGGRRAKLRAYELAPAEWEAVLYLDVDTEICGDIRFYFELIEDGWEFVICKDPHLMDTMHAFRRSGNALELAETEAVLHTLHVLQLNGGSWAFARKQCVAAFFRRWQAEYELHVQRDQGALIRAMYADPLRVYVLGNEWNWFERYSRVVEPAGLKHFPGRARRWKGLIPGRIDSPLAWSRVQQFENGGKHGRRGA